jgi:tetratricopeptide (TPR) repeat protein
MQQPIPTGGVALGNLRRYEEAIEKYKEALRLNPRLAEAWYNKACAFSLWGKKKDALENLNKTIKLDAKYKEKAKTDEDFKNLWEDEDFKRLVE